MKDAQIQNGLARLMVIGVCISAGIIGAGLVWFLSAHLGDSPGDHIFSGEPRYFENLIAMTQRALDLREIGHRRSVVMIGIILLLINPILRVAFAGLGFLVQRDRLYTAVSVIVFCVLLFSFFW